MLSTDIKIRFNEFSRTHILISNLIILILFNTESINVIMYLSCYDLKLIRKNNSEHIKFVFHTPNFSETRYEFYLSN